MKLIKFLIMIDFSNDIEISEVVDNWRVKNMIKNYCDYALKVIKVFYNDIRYDNCMVGSRSYVFNRITNDCFDWIKCSGLIKFKSPFYSPEKLKLMARFNVDRYVIAIYNGRSRVGYISKPSCYQNPNDPFLGNIAHAIWYCFRMMCSIDEQEIDQKTTYEMFVELFIKKIEKLFDREINLYDTSWSSMM